MPVNVLAEPEPTKHLPRAPSHIEYTHHSL